MYRKVNLLGELSKFGPEWYIEASTIADVVRCIDCQEPEFRAFLINCLDSGLDLAIVSKNKVEDPVEVFMDNFGGEEVFISLAPAGAGKGWGKILAAIIIAVVVTVGTGGWSTIAGGTYTLTAGAGYFLTAVATSLAIQGITQLLTKTPKTDKEDKGPGIFDGPQANVKQGTPVPILYGELLVAGATFHVDFKRGSSRAWTFSSYSLADRPGDLTPVQQSENVLSDYVNIYGGFGNPGFGIVV